MEQLASPGRTLQPLRSLQRHWRIAAAVTLALTLAALPIAWIKGRSEYTAEAVFEVFPAFHRTLTQDKELELQSNSQYREFVNQLSRSVLRYETVQAALARLRAEGSNPCTPAETDRRCIERLQRVVYVIAVNDTYMVRVGMGSRDKGEPDRVVNALMDEFLKTSHDEQIFGADERTRALLARRQSLEDELAGLSVARDRLAVRLGLTTFGENTTNPYDLTLARAREQLVLAGTQRAEAQGALDAFNAQRELPLSAGRSVLDMRLQDNGLQALRNEVVKRSEELDREVSGLADRHPARAPALEERDRINQRLQAREADFEKVALKDARARLTASLTQASEVEKEARERVRRLEGQAGAFAADFREAMRITGEMRKRDQEIADVRDRLNYLATESRALGFVRLVTPALPADVPQGIGRVRLFASLLLAALLVGAATAVARDLFDRRVLLPRDAEKAMGVGAAAWIADARDTATGLIAADQVRRLASTLLRQRRRGARNAFGFTSARSGGGTTALVHALAQTLDRLGARALVVDANTLSRRAGEATATLEALLAGRAGADEVVCRQERNDAHYGFVPCGPMPETGLQQLDRLQQALDRWSQQYDVVLVDLPPLLPSADAELLVDLLGQVFLVVEAGSVSRADVARSRSALKKLDPDAVGLVVTRVDFAATGGVHREHAIEHVTRGRYDRAVTLSWARLQWLSLRASLAQRHTR